ncbi:MAG: hypothetical protein ACETWM_03090 [Candidatus Lokiarchaeia archaeon]
MLFVYFASIWSLFPVISVQLAAPYSTQMIDPGFLWLISPEILVENYLRGTTFVGAILIVGIILLSIGIYGMCLAGRKRGLGFFNLSIGILVAIISTTAIFLSVVLPSYELTYDITTWYFPPPISAYYTLIIQVGANIQLFMIAFISLAIAFLVFGPALILTRSVVDRQELALSSGIISIVTGGFFFVTAFPFTRSIFGPTAFILMAMVSIILIIVFLTAR